MDSITSPFFYILIIDMVSTAISAGSCRILGVQVGGFITLDSAQEVIQPTVGSEKSGKVPQFN